MPFSLIIYIMLKHKNITSDQIFINYDTTLLTNQKYELIFVLSPEDSGLQAIVDQCEKNYWLYKIIDSENGQKHVWIKGWEG